MNALAMQQALKNNTLRLLGSILELNADPELAIFEALILKYRVKCPPNQDVIVRLLLNAGAIEIAQDFDSGPYLCQSNSPDLMHDPDITKPWLLHWLIDPTAEIALDNTDSIELSGKYDPFSDFSKAWDLRNDLPVFDSIRQD